MSPLTPVDDGSEAAGQAVPSPREPRRVWLHLASDSSVKSRSGKRRPETLIGLVQQDSTSPFPSTTGVTGVPAFAFISPVEPLARFSKSLNRVYIPLDSGQELAVDANGIRASEEPGSNFALMGSPGSSLLGQGAFGSVYKALHFPTMKRVAIKKIPKDFGRSFEFVNSFARELRSLYFNLCDLAEDSAVVVGRFASSECCRQFDPPQEEQSAGHCPYLVTLYDAYLEKYPISLCLVLEYMEGGSCEKFLAAGARCQDEDTLRSMSYNVVKGLDFLHARGRLHQDVKPANILLTVTNFAKLSDFGLSTLIHGTEDGGGRLERTGTARYWPPEMWGPEKVRDGEGRGDVWSLGLSLLSMMNGREPLANCTTRVQVEIELFDAWTQAYERQQSHIMIAEEKGIVQKGHLTDGSFSVEFVDFVDSCLTDLDIRPTARELLEHRFFEEHINPTAARHGELKAAVAALKTHIAIHKDWKVTRRMVESLAQEIRVNAKDLWEYLTCQLGEPADDGILESSEMHEDSSGPATGTRINNAQIEANTLEDLLMAKYDELDRLKNAKVAELELKVQQLTSVIDEQNRELVAARAKIVHLSQQLQSSKRER